MTTPDFSCEAESSCRVKLASTKGKTCGLSGGGVGLSNPIWGECEFVVEVRDLVDDLVVWSAMSEDFR